MRSYVLSSKALLDLDDIWGYIAQDDIEAAERWIAKLLGACETLARNPNIGHHGEEISDASILLWPVGAYLIIYRICRDDWAARRYKLACHGNNRLRYGDRHAFLGGWIDR